MPINEGYDSPIRGSNTLVKYEHDTLILILTHDALNTIPAEWSSNT